MCVYAHQGKQSVLVFLLVRVFVCLFLFFLSSCSCLLLLCDSDYIVIALDIVLLRVHARRANVYQEKMNVEFDLSGLSDRHVRRVNRLKLPNNTVAKFT